jgi:hypothetical protein
MRAPSLDETMRDFYMDWETTVVKVIAGLRGCRGALG